MGLKEALISDKIALLALRIVLYKEIITINQFMKEGGLSKYTHITNRNGLSWELMKFVL